jgi:hypothetical protein
VLINVLLFGNFRIKCSASDGDGVFDFATFHVVIAIQPPKVFSLRPGFEAITVAT